MIYYLQHKGTEVVFFEKKENFMATLEKALKYAETEAEDGFDLDIKVGVTFDVKKFNKDRRGCNSAEEAQNWNEVEQ